jgi:predicted site-specific integrase-resolvase
MASELIRLKQAAQKWGIAVSTLHEQVRQGRARVMPCMVNPYRWRLRDIERDIDTASYSDSRRKQQRDRKTTQRDLQLAKGA